MKKFKECIIHIGTEKTGTSTLQLFFNENRLNLAQNNILYPKTLGEPSHVKLPSYATDIHIIDDLRRDKGLINEKLIKNFRKKLEKSFREEIQSSHCSKLLISSEHLHSRLTTLEEVKLVKNFLDNFVESYKIIVYLRPQHDMATSLFSTKCKLEKTKNSIIPQTDSSNLYFNFEKLLNRWEEIFGFESLNVRIFSKEEFPENDIKRDFMKILGLNWIDFIDVKKVNESIDSEAQMFLLEMNKLIPVYTDGKRNPIKGDLAHLVSKDAEGKGLLPTRTEVERFLKNFSKSNEEVRKKWFPERKELFKIDLSKYPEKSNFETDYKFAFKIFAKVWELKQKQIFNLRRENEELKKLLGKS